MSWRGRVVNTMAEGGKDDGNDTPFRKEEGKDKFFRCGYCGDSFSDDKRRKLKHISDHAEEFMNKKFAGMKIKQSTKEKIGASMTTMIRDMNPTSVPKKGMFSRSWESRFHRKKGCIYKLIKGNSRDVDVKLATIGRSVYVQRVRGESKIHAYDRVVMINKTKIKDSSFGERMLSDSEEPSILVVRRERRTNKTDQIQQLLDEKLQIPKDVQRIGNSEIRRRRRDSYKRTSRTSMTSSDSSTGTTSKSVTIGASTTSSICSDTHPDTKLREVPSPYDSEKKKQLKKRKKKHMASANEK